MPALSGCISSMSVRGLGNVNPIAAGTAAVLLLCAGCATGRPFGARRADAGGEVTLCRDGRATATIVTAAQCPATVELAVLELQHHFRKMTGRQLARRTDAEKVDGPVILVGESRRTRELGLRNDGFQRQEYLVQTRPDTLILIGHDRQVFGPVRYDDPIAPDDTDLTTTDGRHHGYFYQFPFYPGWTQYDAVGTLYAVYDFLERFCGVRWYLPGPEGSYVPVRKDLVFSGIALRRKPAMTYRHGGVFEFAVPRKLYTGNRSKLEKISDNPVGARRIPVADILPSRETILWALRNKAFGDYFHANHSFLGWYARFYKEHPDWFAQGREYKQHVGGLELCLTNPEVKRQMIQDARDAFAKGADFFTIVPTDSGEWCLCEECQAKMEPGLGNKGRASRYVWEFIGEVADAVADSHPDRYISTLAYASWTIAPEGMKRHESLAVMYCVQPTNSAWLPAQDERHKKLIGQWFAVAGRGVYVWLYTCYPQYVVGDSFPDLSYNKYADWMRYFYSHGVKGWYDNLDFGVEVHGQGRYWSVWPNPMEDFFREYVMVKLSDDISIDEQELYDEFYRLWYGKAAEPIKAFVLKAQERYNDPVYKINGIVQPEGFAADKQRLVWQNPDPIWASVCTAEDLQELGGHIAQAYRQADTSQARRRVKLFDEAIYQGIVRGRAKWDRPDRRPEDAASVSRSFDRLDYQSLLTLLREVEVLPVAGWKFMADAESAGTERGFWKPDYPEDSMEPFRVGEFWDNLGHRELKEGWYRLHYTAPELPEGKRVFLRFGAVDEAAWLYIDGKLAAWYNPIDVTKTWNKPVFMEVSGSLAAGKEQTLVVRVTNAKAAGGLWKPVALFVEK